MLQTAHSGEKPAEPPPRGNAHVASPKWAALLNDLVVPAPQQRIPATLLRSQAVIGDDLVLVRDHNSPDDVIIRDDDTIDLAKGNVFYTLRRDQAGNRGRCQAPPKLAYFIDDRAEITTNPSQSGRTLRELFGLDADSQLMRDFESPTDEPIGPTDSADFNSGPVFVTRQAVPTVIIVNGKRRRVTAPSLTFSELVALALVVQHSFSSKPAEGYADYYHKMTTYYGLVSAPAISKHPGIYLNEPTVLHQADDHEIFQYLDTASSRAGIGRITNKLRLDSVSIVGLGGTGSYVLDLVAKTPVRQIHLYDGDSFLQHNAFRSPGAASLEQLRARATKVEYFSATYSAMHKGIVPHNMYVTEKNVSELRQMNFVFICLDNSVARKLITSALIEHKIPFVDVGMGIHAEGDSLLGIVRQTACTPHMNAHAASRIPMSSADDHGPYNTNIQIADLNALNAALAVIKWKKLCGFYLDLDQEHHSTYTPTEEGLLTEATHAATRGSTRRRSSSEDDGARRPGPRTLKRPPHDFD